MLSPKALEPLDSCLGAFFLLYIESRTLVISDACLQYLPLTLAIVDLQNWAHIGYRNYNIVGTVFLPFFMVFSNCLDMTVYIMHHIKYLIQEGSCISQSQVGRDFDGGGTFTCVNADLWD